MMFATAPRTLSYEGREYRPFFLRGHMRSGTNWTGAILNLHPQINCRGEYHFEQLAAAFEEFCSPPLVNARGSEVARCARECFQDTVCRCMAQAIGEKPDAQWQGDRTPSAIDTLLPGAPTVNIVRDGRDVIVSWAFHRLGMNRPFPNSEYEPWRREFQRDPRSFVSHPEKLLRHAEPVRWRIREWRDQVRADRDKAESLRVEGEHLVHTFTYEALHEDPEGTRAGMYAFLGLDPGEAAPLSGLASPGFGRPEDPTSFYRRGEVGGWRDYFTPEAKAWFKEEAGDLLIELGYERDLDW